VDKDKFSADAPGKLIAITTPVVDWAFVPNPPPKNFQLPAALNPLLIQAREKLARLDGAGRYLPENTFMLRPIQRREALRSSALEGTYATAEELLAYGLEPKEPTSDRDPVNAWREVFNYDAALQLGQSMLEELPLSSRIIRSTHERLLSGVRGADRTPGEYRKRQVHVGSDRRFVPAPPEEVPELIAELERYMNDDTDSSDPLIRSFMAHYQFETIHPFLDGNGRIGRLLLSLMVYKECELQSPWLYLSPYFERYKDEYIDRLFSVSATGDWNRWLELCLRATIEESEQTLRRIDALLDAKHTYERRLATMRKGSARLHQILGYLLSDPLVTVPKLVSMLKVTFPTAQADVRKLIDLKILETSGRKSTPQYYIAMDFFRAAYSDLD
jgi:Fic family protein